MTQACTVNLQPVGPTTDKAGTSSFKYYKCGKTGHRTSKCRKADRLGKALCIEADEFQDDTVVRYDQVLTMAATNYQLMKKR